MKLICLSEHFPPRVGGTSRYVKDVCQALTDQGVDVQLLVPGLNKRTNKDDAEFSFRVIRLGRDFPASGEPTRGARYAFCKMANHYVQEAIHEGNCRIVHVLYGLFLMEILQTAAFRRAGVPSVATVHNVPPMECARSWPGDIWHKRAKDFFHLKVVGAKNANRIRRNPYDQYVVPCDQVKSALTALLPTAEAEVIGHGASDDILEHIVPASNRRPVDGVPVRLLTVGGWAPHKCQLLIPLVADGLRNQGIKFTWDILGPSGRVLGYKDAVVRRIHDLCLQKFITAYDAVPHRQLVDFYQRSHLYIQPSTEEGFCMTALDAAGAGLPVIGSSAGALREICTISGGFVTQNHSDEITHRIAQYIKQDLWPRDALRRSDTIRSNYSWPKVAAALRKLYLSQIKNLHQKSKD